MQWEEITLAVFAACNSLRILAYLPQMHKAAIDNNGASAISYTTWSLFLLAHLSTVAYAIVNRADWWLALCFASNAVCCIAILGIAHWKARRHAARLRRANGATGRRDFPATRVVRSGPTGGRTQSVLGLVAGSVAAILIIFITGAAIVHEISVRISLATGPIFPDLPDIASLYAGQPSSPAPSPRVQPSEATHPSCSQDCR